MSHGGKAEDTVPAGYVYDATSVHRLPLKERITYHYGPGCLDYHTLLDRVFPPKHFPKARRCSSNGGPPGCAMAFGKALRELGIYPTRDYGN